MGKRIKYSNDRSFDNLILILIHTYMDLKSLSKQAELSKNYLINKQDCLQDIQNAYFWSPKLSRKEWDGKHYNDFTAEVPMQEINWFNATLNLAKEIYFKLEVGSNVSDEDLKSLSNYIQDCISLLYTPLSFRTDLLS
tara:strand:+ start:345 stop:758 length:414 start_codon:yes stop_codon:yes gene_type:complete